MITLKTFKIIFSRCNYSTIYGNYLQYWIWLACRYMHRRLCCNVFLLYLILVREEALFIDLSITKTQKTTIPGITSINYFCNVGDSCPPNTATDTFTCCNTNNCNTFTPAGTLTCYLSAGSNTLTLNGCASCAVSLI